MTTSPVPTSRYVSLDVLRGIAIVGTLATNIWIFTNVEGLIGYVNGTGSDDVPAPWLIVERVLQQLAQGKFLGLLTLMFGIGLEIQRRSAVRNGRPWPGRYPVRAALLFLDGLLNFLLVAEFDVLMGYALTAVVVAYVLATSERTQRTVVIVAAGVHLLLLTALSVALQRAPTGSPAPLDPNPYADGSWWDLVLFRIDNLALFRAEMIVILPLSIAMFLLGSWLVRARVLEPGGAVLRRRLMILGALALAADLALGFGLTPAGIVAARYGTAAIVALGLLALVVELIERRPDSGFGRTRLAEVGRMALSCYVAQNLLAGAICYGWGLGVASWLTPATRVPGTIAVYLVVATITVAFAHLWLRHHHRGPLELAWLWCFEKLDRRAPVVTPGRSPRRR